MTEKISFKQSIKHLTMFYYGYRVKDKLVLLGYCIIHPMLFIFANYFHHSKNKELKFEPNSSEAELIEKFYNILPEIYMKQNGVIFVHRPHSLDLQVIKPSFEYKTTEVIMNSIKEGVFIDVGAHIGRYALMIAKQLDGHGKSIAFEPNPGNVSHMERLKELNHLTNLIIVGKGCMDKNETLTFFMDEHIGSSNSSFFMEPSTPYDKIKIECVKLDDWLRKKKIKFEDVKLLKVDAEGSSYNVLKGAESLIKKAKPRIIVEMYAERDKKCRPFLENLGYKIKQIDTWNFLCDANE